MKNAWATIRLLARLAWLGLQIATMWPVVAIIRLLERRGVVELERRGHHYHHCDACGRVWSHDDRTIKSVRAFDKAHKCPACGTKQKRVYHHDKLRARLDNLITTD